MAEFKSHRSYRIFAATSVSRWRFTRSPDQAEFLETLLATSAKKEEVVPAGSPVWRAQVGHDWRPEESICEKVPCPFPEERMKPLRDRAFEGRVNPKGIPFLYVATQEETAVAEVRPWVGAFVSVAKLTTARELRLINFTSDDHRIMLYFNEPDAPERECAVWRDIDRAFSRPVVAGDDAAGYVPTQIVAEVFRQHGFDGVAYRSSLGPGHNIAFFDLDAAAILNRSLVEIRSVKVEYE